jgi:hypothetical protein
LIFERYFVKLVKSVRMSNIVIEDYILTLFKIVP